MVCSNQRFQSRHSERKTKSHQKEINRRLCIFPRAACMDAWHNFQPNLPLKHNGNFSSTKNNIPNNRGWTNDPLFSKECVIVGKLYSTALCEWATGARHQTSYVLQKIVRSLPCYIWFTLSWSWFKLQKRAAHVFIYLHDGCHVPTAVTVVGCTEHCHHILFLHSIPLPPTPKQCVSSHSAQKT